MPRVERNREDRARLPLERRPLPGVVPHRRRAAPVEDVDHLLVQLALRRELLAGRNLADVAVVRGARRVVIEEDAAAAAPRPRLQLDGVQVGHVERADDVEPFGAHPARVRRLLFGRRTSARDRPRRARPWPCSSSARRPPRACRAGRRRSRSAFNSTDGSYSGASSICSRSFSPHALKMRLIDRDEPHRPVRARVEMLVDGVGRNVDDVARLPLVALHLVLRLPVVGVGDLDVAVLVQVVAVPLDTYRHSSARCRCFPERLPGGMICM